MSDRFKKIFEKYEIQPEDANTFLAEEPRNMLADTLNPYLDKIDFIPSIPKVSVADRKNFMNETLGNPENMALSMGLGGIGKAALKVAEFNPALGEKISKAFKEMEHSPNDPKVKSAYNKLIEEVTKQYDDLIKSGLQVHKMKDGVNPYGSSKELIEKVKNTNKLEYFPTEKGFGTSPSTLDNPMLNKTGRLNSSNEEMLANDLFRVVHDYYGHVRPGASFGPKGEEMAYQAHKQMLSPEAQKALATETRGQNSFVNFGDNAAYNKANPKDTIYADQKIGLLPDWAVNENAATTEVTDPAIRKFLGLFNNKD